MHSHPREAIPTLCSTLETVRRVYFEDDQFDRQRFGKSILEETSTIVSEAPNAIVQSGLSCAHVLQEDLIAEPLETIKKIYRQHNLPFSSDYEEVLKTYLANSNVRETLKLEKLSKQQEEDFGLPSETFAAGALGDYIRAFHIAP